MNREAFETRIVVNGTQLDLNPFIADYIAKVTVGMVSSLKGGDEPLSAQIRFDKSGERVAVKVNDRDVPTDSFAANMIAATLRGMISPLKGGSDIDSCTISVRYRNT